MAMEMNITSGLDTHVLSFIGKHDSEVKPNGKKTKVGEDDSGMCTGHQAMSARFASEDRIWVIISRMPLR